MGDFQVPSPQSGTFTAVVNDNNGNPANVLDADQDFTVTCNWTLNTNLAGILQGTFELSTYVEAVGQGEEKRIGFVSVPIVIGQETYGPTDIPVPAGTLPNQASLQPDESGTYKMITVLTHRNGAAQLSDVVAIEDGPFARIS
jgi:hypothetical protein